jgi:hypothetical protein
VTVDEDAMTVTAPAGITQRALLEFLAGFRTQKAPEGYTLGSFSWFIDQTLGRGLEGWFGDLRMPGRGANDCSLLSLEGSDLGWC